MALRIDADSLSDKRKETITELIEKHMNEAMGFTMPEIIE